METITGIDYSFARPNITAIVQRGYSFVIRYVPYIGDQGKGLGLEELTALNAAGLGVAVVFETTGGEATGGYDVGYQNARYARHTMRNQFNWPDNRPIYYAVDQDVEPEEVYRYFDGIIAAESGVSMVGAYGSYNVIRGLHQTNRAKWLWQTYAWSGGLRYNDVHLYQWLNGQNIDGAAVDFNNAYKADYGAWFGGNQMPLPSEDFAALNRAILMREDIRAVAATLQLGAANPDLPTVEALHARLSRDGYLVDWPNSKVGR